ncbi:MAG: hypothetical protein KC646_07640 [Candidatus Cloacimonetes bacterium]|nr:hypothetical protein [Candidatus Cloacimonadota bacterium]
MKNLLRVVLGVCVISTCTFALDESVENMISRIVGKPNPALQNRIETGLEMGTIEEGDVEQIITDFQSNSQDEGEVGSTSKSTKKDTKTVISIARVSDCFDTLYGMTNNKKFAMVAKNYRKYFKDNGKPLTKSDDGEELDYSDVPFAATDIPTIMMDYSKCLYSVASIKEKLSKLPSQKAQEQNENQEANSGEETGAQAIVAGDAADNDEELDTDENDSTNFNDDEEAVVSVTIQKDVVNLYKKKKSEMETSKSLKIKSSEFKKGLKVLPENFEDLPESSELYPEEMKDIVKSVKKEANDGLSLLEQGVDSAKDFLATMWSFSVEYLTTENEETETTEESQED